MADIERSLISIVVAKKDLGAALDSGVNLDLFAGEYERRVWRWIREHQVTYGETPGEDALIGQWPDFEVQRTTESIAYWADELKQKFVHNLIARFGKTAMGRLKEGDPFGAMEAFRAAVRMADDVVVNELDLQYAEGFRDRKLDYDKRKQNGGIEGMPTPFSPLTEATGGFVAGDFVVIAADSGVGKTWLLVLIVLSLLEDGKMPLLFSKEMASEKLARRLDAAKLKLPYNELRQGRLDTVTEERWEEWIESQESAENRFGEGFVIVGEESGGVSQVDAKCDRHRASAAIIDGFYLMDDERGAKAGWEAVGNVSRDLKRLAKRRKMPVIATAQLAEDGSLAYFKGIKRDADLVIIMSQTEDERLAGVMNFKLRKNREGEMIEWQTLWRLDTMEFTVISGEGVTVEAMVGEADAEEEVGF